TALLPALASGAQAALPDSLRVRALAIPSSARAERLRVIARDAVRADTVDVPLAVSAASLLIGSNGFDDSPAAGGNGNGVVDANETVGYRFTIANEGSGRGRGLSLHLRNAASGVTLVDSTTLVADLATGAFGTAALLRVHVGPI